VLWDKAACSREGGPVAVGKWMSHGVRTMGPARHRTAGMATGYDHRTGPERAGIRMNEGALRNERRCALRNGQPENRPVSK